MRKIQVSKDKIKLALYNSILFSGATENLTNKILKLVKCYLVRRKEKIITERKRGRNIFIVISGRISVYFKSNKKFFLIKRLMTGDIFGEIGFFMDQRTANCEASEDTIVGVINYKVFSELIFKDKKLMSNMVKILISRILDTDKELKDLVFRPVLQRVCNVILSETQHRKRIVLNIQSLSQKTAAARETVSRMITMLERANVVKREEGFLIVLNRPKLKELVK